MKKQPTTTTEESRPVKSAMVTLKANGATLTLLATLKTDGSAVTHVTTRDADKTLTRGMTETHASMDAARAHLATLAEKAEKLGWQRGVRTVASKPDQFSKLPAAPKAVA
jgi:hypothetical protein